MRSGAGSARARHAAPGHGRREMIERNLVAEKKRSRWSSSPRRRRERGCSAPACLERRTSSAEPAADLRARTGSRLSTRYCLSAEDRRPERSLQQLAQIVVVGGVTAALRKQGRSGRRRSGTSGSTAAHAPAGRRARHAPDHARCSRPAQSRCRRPPTIAAAPSRRPSPCRSARRRAPPARDRGRGEQRIDRRLAEIDGGLVAERDAGLRAVATACGGRRARHRSCPA